MEAFIKRDDSQTIKYTNTDAVTAKEIVSISGIGAAVAHDTYGASVEGVYYVRGIDMVVPLATSENPQQGDDVYWDVSANQARKAGSASLIETDLFLGPALENATASGGYVLVRLTKSNSIPESTIQEKHVGLTTAAGITTGLVAVKAIGSTQLKALLNTTTNNLFAIKKGDKVLRIRVFTQTASGATGLVTAGPDATARTAGADTDGIIKAANLNAAGVYSSDDVAATYMGDLQKFGVFSADADGYITCTSSTDQSASSFVGAAVMEYIPA